MKNGKKQNLAHRCQQTMDEMMLSMLIIPIAIVLNGYDAGIEKWWNPIIRKRWPWLTVRAAFYAVCLAVLVSSRYG